MSNVKIAKIKIKNLIILLRSMNKISRINIAFNL